VIYHPVLFYKLVGVFFKNPRSIVINISDILKELSTWSKINDDDVTLSVNKKGDVFINFFEKSPSIPSIYTLDKYVIVVLGTYFIYKDRYEVDAKIDLASNYTEFQKRQ
jgi:hypothetical protein